MNERPKQNEYNPYYATYIDLVPEGDIIGLLVKQGPATIEWFRSLTEAQAEFRYAPGKWSVKEVLGHITDNERVMDYRLLRIARGDTTPLSGYDQDVFMSGDPFGALSLGQMLDDYAAVRRSTITLLQGLSAEAWLRRGSANGSEITAKALAYINAGHERHHMNILKERYTPAFG